MTDLQAAHVLVVGATGGLGSAIARRLAEVGARLTRAGRSTERLAALAEDLGPTVIGTVVAPVRLARAAVPVLPKGGFLVHLSAVVAERPMPSMAAYSAAKAGLTAFDAAMATELRRRGIRVLDVRPPHTETGLAGRPISGQAPALPTGLDPDQVARRIVQAIQDDEKDLPATSFG